MSPSPPMAAPGSRQHASRRRVWLVTAILGAAILALAAGGLVLEYRTQYVATRLGQYLLAHNAQRPRAGAIWQAIEGSRQQRTRQAPVAPAELDLTSTPAVVMQTSYEVEMGTASLLLQARPLYAPLQPGHTTREQMGWLARNLAAYRAGQKLLGAALLPEAPYRRRARARLDSLLAGGDLFPLLDQALRHRGVLPAWLFAVQTPPDSSYWQARLLGWLQEATVAGTDTLRPWTWPAPDSAAGPPDTNSVALPLADAYPTALHPVPWPPSSPVPGLAVDQERAYQEACVTLHQYWADSLYTRDYLRLVGAWTDGQRLSASALLQESELAGQALFADGCALPFSLSRERAARAVGSRVSTRDDG
ncbi:MAG: hypothetical protein ABIL09_08005 [Gemmatimonadota bacterium]